MNAAPEPVRVALIGCGAVARLYYRPALQALERGGSLRLIAAHDPDPAALHTFGACFPAARRMARLPELLETSPQLVIVASPPRYHLEQTIEALDAGADVHCEKPLAPGRAEGERMIAAARAAGRRLSIGMVRRYFAATRTIGRLIDAGTLGPLRSIDCFEGSPFSWPVRSEDFVNRGAGAAGVLQDIGTHCLDLLTWWLGSPSTISYQDDAMGGVEANCRIELTFGDVPATVRLSRDWAQPNRYLITGRDGWVAWTVNETNHFDYGIGGTDYAGDLTLHEAPADVRRSALGPVAADFDEAFTDQVRSLVGPASGACEPVLAVEALPTMDLIDRCYASRRPMPMSWMVPGWAEAT